MSTCGWGSTCTEPAIATVNLATRAGTLNRQYGRELRCAKHLALDISIGTVEHVRNGFGLVVRPLKWVAEVERERAAAEVEPS